jgi:type IV secretory pathway TrbD component
VTHKELTVIAMQMNGNPVLIFFFNIAYIMKLNLNEKLWLMESRSVLLWSLGFRVRAHKNSPADPILNRIFQQTYNVFL